MPIYRIEVTPEVFRIVESEAFLTCKSMKSIASDVLSKHCSKEAIALAGRRGHIVIKPDEHQDKEPDEQTVEEPKSCVVADASYTPTRPRLAHNQPALSRIKELWNLGEHNSAEIARQINYPRKTTHTNIKRMLENGELQESP
jgi:hypothetical protein